MVDLETENDCSCRYHPTANPPLRCLYESNPLLLAVRNNDLSKLKSLITSGESINSKKLCVPLLNRVMEYKRVEMFDYLLSLPELALDSADGFGRSALLYTISDAFDEYFALKLINSGANIYLRDISGFTVLHMAARNSSANLKIGQMLIAKGVDVNAQASFGVTPLYTACEEGNLDWVYMLLYYGADATISSDKGVLPLAVLSQTLSVDDHATLQEILFNHTFEGNKISIRLPTLVAAMAQDSFLFPKLVEIVSEVDYDISDLEYLFSFFCHLKARHFKLFINKFGEIVQEMLQNFSLLYTMLNLYMELEIPEIKALFLTILESNYVTEFVHCCGVSYGTIGRLVQICNNIPEMYASEEEVTKIVCLMLSHGSRVVSDDLDMVYFYYNYCELFKILLHMEIEMVNGGKNGYSMAILYYDPSTSIESFFNEMSISSDLLSFYNHPKLKQLCLSDTVNPEIAAKAKTLPSVSSLMELSRNMARKFIIDRFETKNSVQFYTALQGLPIPEITKQIIALEKKLY